MSPAAWRFSCADKACCDSWAVAGYGRPALALPDNTRNARSASVSKASRGPWRRRRETGPDLGNVVDMAAPSKSDALRPYRGAGFSCPGLYATGIISH